jgi:hypothetical protein
MLLMGQSTISMAIFNSYVKLPEGSPPKMGHRNSGFIPLKMTIENGLIMIYHIQ